MVSNGDILVPGTVISMKIMKVNNLLNKHI